MSDDAPAPHAPRASDLNMPQKRSSVSANAPSQPRASALDESSLEGAEASPAPSASTRAAARFSANPSVRFGKKLGHNLRNKVEDVGIGLLGVTDVIAEAGEGVGRTAVSGVGAVGSAVEGSVTGAFGSGTSAARKVPAKEVDTVTEVDISGTILKDLNREIEVEKMKGTNNAESPLNTPWILLIFPIAPIAFMYTKTAMEICVPPAWAAVRAVWTFFGWRFWFLLFIIIILVAIFAWEKIKAIESLRNLTMRIDVHLIKFGRKLHRQANRQKPKIHKAMDKILPPITASLVSIDAMLVPKLGYSPMLAVNARINGWIYDPKIKEIRIGESSNREVSGSGRAPANPADFGSTEASGEPDVGTTLATSRNSTVQLKRDRGQAVVMSGEGVCSPGSGGLEFDASRVRERVSDEAEGAAELYEQFFKVEICLRELSELHRQYTSVWVEWLYRDMVVDRSVIRDISMEGTWTGAGASFDDYTLTGEVRLPLRADTTEVKGGFYDVPIKLILKGRDGLPIYGSDGARRYMRNSPEICVIGEIELSALRIGVGADAEGIVRSELRIPMHAVGIEQYRAAVLRASARMMPIDSSSYSYRQMLSPLPNGEWTVRINVFELRNLKGVDDSGSSDPFVSASVLGMVKKTDRQRQTLSCMVNQLLFFSRQLTGLEFEDQKIVIDVMDWNRFGAPKKIGVYTLDAKRVLELPGHELFRKWFALQDPAGGKRPSGFIKMSITVVPPGASVPQHDETEDKEEFSSANLLKNTVIKAPKMSYENWAVHITLGWADMLPRMSSARYRDVVRGYVTFHYSGWEECRSNVFISEAKEVIDNNIGDACGVLPQRRVIWNEEYILPLTVINGRVAQEGIGLKLYHRVMPRLQDPFRTDQLIGQVNVSFEELFKNMTRAVVRGDPADGEDPGDRMRDVGLMRPRYYNFYGMGSGPADPYDKGAAFRGRVLVGAAAKPGEVLEPFMRPCPPPPRPKLEFYKMQFSVLRATELPLPDGWSVRVECRIGLYRFGHTIPKATVSNLCAEWDEQCGVSIPNMQFPEEVEQIPDFFVTLTARKPATVTELEEKMAADTQAQGGPVTPATNAVTNDSSRKEKAAKRRNSDAVESVNDGAEDAGSSGEVVNPGAAGDLTSDNGAADTAWSPKAFLRLPAKHLICGQQTPRWVFMDYPGNDVLDSDETKVPGSMLVSAALSKYDPTRSDVDEKRFSNASLSKTPASAAVSSPTLTVGGEVGGDDEEERPSSSAANGGLPSRKNISGIAGSPARAVSAPTSSTFSIPLGPEKSYNLRAYVLQGRNLPAADESGLSDPKIVVSMGDRSVKGNVLCKMTVSPFWDELIEVEDIKIREGERKPNVNVLIYDDDGDLEPMKYLGRSIIPCAELDTAPPSLEFSKWYPVFSVNPGVVVGEILADFQLIPREMAIAHPMLPPTPPLRSSSALRISLVGLRDVKFLQYAVGNLYAECFVSGESMKPQRSKSGAILQQRAFEANCNILDVLVLEIKIPEDLRLAPTLNMYVYADFDHAKKSTLVATACIPLEKWLAEHNRRLLTGENLIDDSFGTDARVPERLLRKDRNYKFRRNARLEGDGSLEARARRLHEINPRERGEKKNMHVMQENEDVLQIGFPAEAKPDKPSPADTPVAAQGTSWSEKIAAALAPIRAVKYQVADTLADLMPDIAMALGIEVEEDVPISALLGSGDDDDDKVDYDGTMQFKKERGYCPTELELEFSEPAYGEFMLFRGDNRFLGNTVGRIDEGSNNQPRDQAFPPLLPFDEIPTSGQLVKQEKKRAALEGARPAVGKVKARLDLIEMDTEDEIETKKVRLTSLRSFGRVFVPTEVVVRLYIMRAINLQQTGSQCNPYLTTKFFGGYPDFYSQKHEPETDNDNPNFFDMFESRVKMPGGSIRITVKDRVLPEITVPVSYPMYISEDGQRRVGIVQRDIPVNVGKLGFGWSETIGETVIDLDSRWYNSSWRSLAKTPIELRNLYSGDSTNLKGQLECFVDIFDAKDVDKRPKLFRPVPISKPPQAIYELRVVIYKISDCTLPYKLANNDPTKLAAFYVQARLGNHPEDEKSTSRCRHVADGVAEFNWRMKWRIHLPSVDLKPRLKLQVFDDTSFGLGDDQLCATADIKLRSLFDSIIVNKKPLIKKRQWVIMEHPNHPEVATRLQLSFELTTAESAAKKKCFAGKDGYKDTQHEDYILPEPFQPAAFSLYNPVPYFNYLIISTIRNLQWQVATGLLIFPFIPMFVQFVFMLTPWQWYAAGGVVGLAVLVRIQMVNAARTSRMQAEQEAAKSEKLEEEDEEE